MQMNRCDQQTEDVECISCGSKHADKCPKSRRPCGHHCNHSWSHGECCWCWKLWDEEPEVIYDYSGRL